jgi:two-component system response regulator YesN
MEPNEFNPDAFRYYYRLERVRQYVETHYSEAIPLELAARLAGTEKKYFSSYFHQKTGICYSRWLTAVRVTKAMDLIKAADMSLTRVAHRVGFRDLRTFQRSFKKLTGVTPRAFKKAVRPS